MRRAWVMLAVALLVVIPVVTVVEPPTAAAEAGIDIVILGGPAAVGNGVMAHLSSCTSGMVRRVSGSNRYATAVEVSKATFTHAGAVFLATASNFPDAVAAGSPAAIAGSPVLLTGADSIPSATIGEIQRLGVEDVYLLGGTGVIRPEVESQLSGIADVTRLAGTNRYATAAAISAATFASASTVFIATGADFPDALAGAPAAASVAAPILLVSKDGIPGPTQTELDRLAPSTVVVLGGTGVVSEEVLDALPGVTKVRLAGSNRFATAAAISKWAFPVSASTIYITTGYDFPDALAGGAAAGYEGGPVLLAGAGVLPQETATEISRLTGQPCAALPTTTTTTTTTSSTTTTTSSTTTTTSSTTTTTTVPGGSSDWFLISWQFANYWCYDDPFTFVSHYECERSYGGGPPIIIWDPDLYCSGSQYFLSCDERWYPDVLDDYVLLTYSFSDYICQRSYSSYANWFSDYDCMRYYGGAPPYISSFYPDLMCTYSFGYTCNTSYYPSEMDGRSFRTISYGTYVCESNFQGYACYRYYGGHPEAAVGWYPDYYCNSWWVCSPYGYP